MIQLLVFFGALLGLLAGIGYTLPTGRRYRYFRIAGLGLMATFTVLGALFIVGETLTDLGGWPAVGLIALWLVPLLALVTLALARPGWALTGLTGLTALVLGLDLWFVIDPGPWRSFEDANGPVRTIAGFVVVAALAALGWHRPARAGWLLLAVGALPVVLLLFATGDDWLPVTSWTVVGVPGVVAGTLYLLAARTAGSITTPASPLSGPGPPETAPTG